jgi:MoxR-like ATPase
MTTPRPHTAPLARRITLHGVELHLSTPETSVPPWVGQREVLLQLVAAWSRFDESDLPLNPRLLGKPGVGKTTLGCAAAQAMGLPIYIMQGTMDTRPEDLIVSPVLAPEGGLRYMASPLVSAMVHGGVCILDEGNRMSEKAWASLAPLLDHRRYVESLVAGIKIQASPEFRFVTTMNEDASTYEIPEYIHSRLMPQIVVDFPDEADERAILEAQVGFADGEVLDYVMRFLRAAHGADLRYTARDGINVARYAMKLLKRREAGDAKAAVRVSLRLAIGREEADLFDIF